MYQVVDNLSHQAGAHALRAGVDFLFNDDTITYPAIVSRQLHVLVAAELPDRQLQRLHPDLRRSGGVADESEHRDLRAGRVERRLAPDAEPRPSLRPAVSGTDQHRHQQRVAARRVRVVAVGVAAISWFAAAPGCSSTACRCVPSRTPSCRPATRPISAICISPACRASSRRRPARRRSRTSCPRAC